VSRPLRSAIAIWPRELIDLQSLQDLQSSPTNTGGNSSPLKSSLSRSKAALGAHLEGTPSHSWQSIFNFVHCCRREYRAIFAIALHWQRRYRSIERNAQRSSRTTSMARTCTICHHHRRDTIDKALLRGEQLKAVARHYSVSDDALGRHRMHMQMVIAKAAALVEQKDLAYGSALLAEIGRIRADAERLQIEFERRQDVRGPKSRLGRRNSRSICRLLVRKRHSSMPGT
jgi:hypothetical protein